MRTYGKQKDGAPALAISPTRPPTAARKGDGKMKLFDRLRSSALARDTRGLSTVEYVIILCLIAAVAVGLWNKFGSMVKTKLEASAGEIDDKLPESF
jgi:Flp pilus assembly pilin Flp